MLNMFTEGYVKNVKNYKESLNKLEKRIEDQKSMFQSELGDLELKFSLLTKELERLTKRAYILRVMLGENTSREIESCHKELVEVFPSHISVVVKMCDDRKKKLKEKSKLLEEVSLKEVRFGSVIEKGGQTRKYSIMSGGENYKKIGEELKKLEKSMEDQNVYFRSVIDTFKGKLKEYEKVRDELKEVVEGPGEQVGKVHNEFISLKRWLFKVGNWLQVTWDLEKFEKTNPEMLRLREYDWNNKGTFINVEKIDENKFKGSVEQVRKYSSSSRDENHKEIWESLNKLEKIMEEIKDDLEDKVYVLEYDARRLDWDIEQIEEWLGEPDEWMKKLVEREKEIRSFWPKFNSLLSGLRDKLKNKPEGQAGSENNKPQNTEEADDPKGKGKANGSKDNSEGNGDDKV